MGQKTSIEWCDSTVNLQMGCDGCELWGNQKSKRTCYAGLLTQRYGGRKGWPSSFDKPALFPERLKEALAWPDLTGVSAFRKPWLAGKPRHIFLDDMGDTFTESLPLDWLLEHIPAMEASPHVWMFLTKRASRMYKFFTECLGYVPGNFKLGVSLTKQSTVQRLVWLRKLKTAFPDAVAWISAEPLLQMLDLDDLAWEKDGFGWRGLIEGVIAGGESGPGARPCHPDWLRYLRDRCMASGVPFFLKQWGEWQPLEKSGVMEGYKLPDGTVVGEWDVPTAEMMLDDPNWNDGFDVDLRWNCHVIFHKVGKKKAGRMLDGREWKYMPGTSWHDMTIQEDWDELCECVKQTGANCAGCSGQKADKAVVA